ncbi:urease accessory protein UreE [Rubellimicrobium roseum]|uniref:Urease accessory protein UreE n=1 Tax=Rubellimicrobium roseum TaxID=687525 RepID=A0A5C4N798_9RHOB|nr:urease accessory protein UreE [Rubellimicrobium roseum]TNC65970.1 urease accessory protein UreE [Rubellimicrobium roseum]
MSAPLLRATAVRRAHDGPVDDRVTLAYEDRLIRRKRIVTDGGLALLVDLPATTGLDDGDALEVEDGRWIAVRAAVEPLLEVRGDLARLAWHIGNRHAPARIEPDRLLVRRDRVMARMLEGLGATLREIDGPFVPEGGAYGEGRVLGHSHGPGEGLGHLAHDPDL